MSDPALSDVTVLELASGVAGPYAARLLVQLGARVTKVEPPGGDPARRELPLVDGESALFAWLNAGKQLETDPLDGSRVEQLAAGADIIVHSERGDLADHLEAAWRACNPRAVILSLTPYGRSGPRSGWKASALTEYATSGFHYFGGKPEREPLALPGQQAEYHAGMHGAIAALAGLWHVREHGGEGQRIEVSHQEAILAGQAWLTSMWSHTGQVQRRAGSIYVPCVDGHVYLFHLVPYPNLFVLIERFDMLEDETLLNPLTWGQRYPEVVAAMAEWAADKTKAEIYHAAQELRIAVSPVNTMADLAANAHLAARGFFTQVEAGGRSVQAPGAPFTLAGGEAAVEAASPEPERRAVEPATGPLAGVRVVEVTANWAGPIAGRHLADLGADVIKVELDTKPATRALIYANNDLAWPRLWERSGYFSKLNRNKRDICLNLASPGGKEVFLELVRQADVVLENNAARVMPQLGLGYEQLRAANPRIVMCSLSGYGGSGPEMHYSAYGSNIETASGLASVFGYEEGDQNGTGSFYADPVSGGHAAVAILAALHQRRRTGRGQWIDVSLLEAVIPFFAQQFLEYSITGGNPRPMGNRHAVHSPQGVYATGGTDCWLALTVENEAQWRGLCRVIGRAGWADDPALATAEGRRIRKGVIDAAITAWCAELDHNDAAQRLQAEGVPAAPVMANWEVLSDNHLHARGFFVSISHPISGTHLWPGFPWRFELTEAELRHPAPLFAQHNAEIFTGIVGLDEPEIAALYETGVTNGRPVYSAGTL